MRTSGEAKGRERPMTYRALREQIRRQLEKAGCDSPAFDADCLLEDLGGGRDAAHSDRDVPEECRLAVERAAAERAGGRPLQYILGRWGFLRLTLEVGEGVLIPRPETELLCLAAADRLRAAADRPLRVYDLCAGSGCVGLGLASLLKGVEVTAVELSPEAFVYLERNCEAYPAYAVRPVLADICRDAGRFPDRADAILSNPPYIPAGELPGLQREVRREPRMALDGGDGLRFYRVIADAWLPKLVPGGFVAVEVGIGQAEAVAELFAQAGLKDVGILPDYAGIGRVVLGFRPI